MRQLFPTAGLTRSSTPSSLPEHESTLSHIPIKHRDGMEASLDAMLRAESTDGFLVLHEGRIAMEWYDGFLTPTTQHTVQSISKSIAALITGILVDKELIDTEAQVIRYVPELEGSGFTGARIRDLLDMTTSLDFKEDLADPDGDSVKFRAATTGTPQRDDVEVVGLRQALRGIKHGKGKHGDTFQYVTPNTDTLGWVLERASGKSYADLLQELLWEPLGAEHEATLLLDVKAAPRTGGGISMTLRDLARIGEMLRGMGVLNGRQVVPGWWLNDMLQNGDEAAWSRGPRTDVIQGPYRSNMYLLGGRAGPTLAGIGSYGQWLYVDMENATVIARFASELVGSDPHSMKHWQQTFNMIACYLGGRAHGKAHCTREAS